MSAPTWGELARRAVNVVRARWTHLRCPCCPQCDHRLVDDPGECAACGWRSEAYRHAQWEGRLQAEATQMGVTAGFAVVRKRLEERGDFESGAPLPRHPVESWRRLTEYEAETLQLKQRRITVTNAQFIEVAKGAYLATRRPDLVA